MVEKLTTDVLKCKVIDVFAVPDYSSWFDGCKSKIEHFAKTKWTQCQFRFEMVNRSADFPLGVCVTYRTYVQDVVTLIVDDEDPASLTGKKPVDFVSRWLPGPPEHKIVGLYILDCLPVFSDLRMEPLVEGSRQFLEALVRKVIAK